MTHTNTHTHTRARALDSASLGVGSTCLRDLSLTTLNTQKKTLTCRVQAGFEPTIPTSERLKTHALDREIYPSPITFLFWVNGELSSVAGVY
jgi:hypothetical protein